METQPTEASPIAGDMSRECYCTCHIAVAKISQNPSFGVLVRIECTQRSYWKDNTGLTCGTCGRAGKSRYGAIEDATAILLWKGGKLLARDESVPKGMGPALQKLRAQIRALDGDVPDMETPARELVSLFLDDGHVGADFENWIRLARCFGKESEARELAAAYDPQGDWEEKEIT